MKKKRLVAVFTGNRAEYGLQFPILMAIKKNPSLNYRLIVTGAHLDSEFGQTVKEIKKDGFNVHAKIKLKNVQESQSSTALYISQIINDLSKELKKIKPDIFLVYADRFEGLAAIITSTQMNIPTAHVEGGDITQGGALDDSVRHAMTKLSHFHFTTNKEAKNRILSMGEEKWRVFNVGFPGIDLFKSSLYATKQELLKKYNINHIDPIILFTQHSVTTEFQKAKKQLEPSIQALMELSKNKVQILITYPNNDVGGKLIKNTINKLNIRKKNNINILQSMGRYNYHGVIALCKTHGTKVVCVGNSSSGIKETPFFGCPTVNIGSRQLGRLRASNVIDVDYNKKQILSAIKKCIYDKKFILKCKKTKNPYGGGNSGKLIAKILNTIDLDQEKVLRKKMTLKGIIKRGWQQ
jgi:UDP-hydrolysing UDP-N-acetyl-D-glucosamine 2-epimerase